MARRGLTSNFALALLVVAALAILRLSPVYGEISDRGFDVLSTLAPPRPAVPGIVLVAIDEPSEAEIGRPFPWPRSIHADLIASLRAAGVKAIGMDIVFAQASRPEEDEALAEAAGTDVVFAAEKTVRREAYGDLVLRTEPIPQLLSRGAQSGLISVTLDGDGVLRSVPAYRDGFARQLLSIAGESVDTEKSTLPGRQRIQYFGPPGSYPRVSYYQALDPEHFLPPDLLKGAVVIVGYNLQATPELGSSAVDAFESPYTLTTGQLLAGPEVHATIFDNLREGLAIAQPPHWLGWVMLALGALAGLAVSRPAKLWHRASLALGVLALTLFAGWLIVRFGRIWVSPLDPIFATGLTALTLGVRDFAQEQRRRKDIQSAFGQYISPVMVERLAANPDLLRLGGERRELTVMFSDIRGFTSISERMKDRPEDLVQLINEILTPISAIVIRNGGTIDKYMGDCIMAFWNAPLDDPEHALAAVRAGQEMLAIMPSVNAKVARYFAQGEGEGPSVKIGIGINTGDCVVGNMGSDQRFDYSVLGDTVNTASRLEGQCKDLGVPIVIGEATALQVENVIAVRALGSITLRGKSEPLAVFTLVEP